VKCSNQFGAKRRRLLKVNIVLAPKGAIQNFIKNIRYDIMDLQVNTLIRKTSYFDGQFQIRLAHFIEKKNI
jgi:hypothetical protein